MLAWSVSFQYDSGIVTLVFSRSFPLLRADAALAAEAAASAAAPAAAAFCALSSRSKGISDILGATFGESCSGWPMNASLLFHGTSSAIGLGLRGMISCFC